MVKKETEQAHPLPPPTHNAARVTIVVQGVSRSREHCDQTLPNT